MPLETSPWDAADYLDSEEMILAYLEVVLEEGDPALIAAALDNVARARGVANDVVEDDSADIGAVIRRLKALGFGLTAKAA